MRNKIYWIIQKSELNLTWLKGFQSSGLPSLLIAITLAIYVLWKL